MTDMQPRIFIEAVEREARDAGLQTIRRYARLHDQHCPCTALLVAERERCAEIASAGYRVFHGDGRRSRDASTRIAAAIRGGSNA